jgi:hypothetical protein
VVLQWCYRGVTDVLQWCYTGVTVVVQWCYSGVRVVLEWCYSGVTAVKSMSARARTCIVNSVGMVGEGCKDKSLQKG